MDARILLGFAAALALAPATPSKAEIPPTIAFQGVLTNPPPLSTPKPDGSYAVVFRIYDAATGGTLLWTEPATGTKNVTVSGGHGLFSTALGDVVPLVPGLSFSIPYWLSIQVGTDPELSPRLALRSVPYALYARNSGGFSLPYEGTISHPGTAFSVTNTGAGKAGYFLSGGPATASPALQGDTISTANFAAAVSGTARGGTGVTSGVSGTNASKSDGAAGVSGVALGGAGATIGVAGVNNSPALGAVGVRGEVTAGAGVTSGVKGITNSSDSGANGVWGVATGAGPGATYGVEGTTGDFGDGAAGVFGKAAAAGGVTSGVSGETVSAAAGAAGVHGLASNATGAATQGVFGETKSTAAGAAGVGGLAGGAIGTASGVAGETRSAAAGATGVQGTASNAAGAATFGVGGLTKAAADGAAGVSGLADAAVGAGKTAGVLGESKSDHEGAAGVRGVGGASGGKTYGVAGTSSSTVDLAAGVYGEGATDGQTYGVHGVTTSKFPGAVGVRGESRDALGHGYGVYGTSNSNAPYTAGVKGDVSASPAADPFATPTIGVWGFTSATIRSEGVRGDAAGLAGPPIALNGRVGVRGYVGGYPNTLIDTTPLVGVEGDLAIHPPDPWVSAGVRGELNDNSSKKHGWSAVLGQGVDEHYTGGPPDVTGLGIMGVYGLSQDDTSNNSAGVFGDSTTKVGVAYGMWGRSISSVNTAAAVRADGNGASVPGIPNAAALEIHNGAIRVSGLNRPAGSVPVPPSPGIWTPLLTCAVPDEPGDIPHAHTDGWFTDVTTANSLVVPDTTAPDGTPIPGSIILATVEAPGPPKPPPFAYAFYAEVVDKKPGLITFRVAAVNPNPDCVPPYDPLKVNYLIINPFPLGS